MEDRFAYVGAAPFFGRMVQAGLTGDVFGPPLPGCTARGSAAEAVARADFAFVHAARTDDLPMIVRSIERGLPAGACAVLMADDAARAGIDEAGERLDALGLAALDLAWLLNPLQLLFGGERDTFDMLKQALAPLSKPLFVGPLGAGHAARTFAGRAHSSEKEVRSAFADAIARGAFPAQLRNVARPNADEALLQLLDGLVADHSR